MSAIIATLDDVRAAVAEAVKPLLDELARLRADHQEQGVSLAEAAERLRVSKRTIQRMVKAGKLPAIPGVYPTRILLSAVLTRDH